MSVVAISQTLGSLGDDIGRRLARVLSYAFADREILLRAAERFGEGAMGLRHATEERPTLWERVTHAERRGRASVEAIIWEMAARDGVVLVGRGSPFILQGIGHALRVRVTASERVRVHRLAQREELGAHAAAGRIRQDTRERGARIRFLYHVDWDDPTGYDLVLNTDRLDVDGAAGLIQDALRRGAFQPTEESLAQVRDRSLTALAKAALLADPAIRSLTLHVDCRNGHLWVSGLVEREAQRQVVADIVATIPGAEGTQVDIALARPRRAPPTI